MFGALIDAATKLGSSGAGSILLPALEGAAAGGLGGALTGQNPLKQALVGGVTGGAMGAFGGANGPLAQYLGVSGPVANALIGGVLGAGGNKLLGLDPLVGAGMGALGGYGYGMQTAPSTDMPTTAENPANQGLLDTLRSNDTATTQAMSETASGRGGGPLGAAAASGNKGLSGTALALAALAALGSGGAKKPALPGPASVAGNLGPTWNQPLNTAVPGRTAVNPYTSQTPSYWTYGGPEKTFFANNSLKSYGFAEGGSPSSVFSTDAGQHYVEGPGDGQADRIPARLSQGEFVVDATTVSRLGNGDNKAGAAVLDRWRKNVAQAAGSPRVVQKKVDPERLMRSLGGAS